MAYQIDQTRDQLKWKQTRDAVNDIDSRLGTAESGVSGLEGDVSSLDSRVTALENTPQFLSGMMMPYGGSSAPSGWLLCNGSAVSRSTYAGLFAVIGTAFGVGDGSTTFNLPDMRGRAPIGVGQGSGLTDRALGASVGAETHTLAETEIPSHSHSGSTGTDGSHSHDVSARPSGGGSFGINYAADGGDPVSVATSTAGAHTHTVSIGSTGGGGSHNNMQPSLAVNFIIKS